VSLVAEGTPAKRRRVLGYSKNPFEPAAAPKVKAEKTPAPSGTAVTPASTGDDAKAPSSVGGSSVGGSSVGGSSAPAGTANSPGTTSLPAAPVTGAAPKPEHELYSLTVRFGSSDSDTLDKRNLPRLKALPSSDEPVLVYLGPGKDAKSAIFMVDEGVEAQGDGVCKPSPANCETLHMREGDTEFFDVTGEDGTAGAQYQLDLIDIKRSATADAAKATKARAKVSRSGRRVLRAHQAAAGPLRYRYDAGSGTVRKVGKRAYEAALARTAHIAVGRAGGF